LNNEKNSNRTFVKQSPLTKSWLRQKLFDEHPKLEWYTFCLVRPWALKVLGVVLGCLSIIVIWSEMTFFSVKPTLSIFALCVKAAREHFDYFTIEVRAFLFRRFLFLLLKKKRWSVGWVLLIYVYVPIIQSFVYVYSIIFIYHCII